MSALAEKIDTRLHDSSSPQRTAIIDEVIDQASSADLVLKVLQSLLFAAEMNKASGHWMGPIAEARADSYVCGLRDAVRAVVTLRGEDGH